MRPPPMPTQPPASTASAHRAAAPVPNGNRRFAHATRLGLLAALLAASAACDDAETAAADAGPDADVGVPAAPRQGAFAATLTLTWGDEENASGGFEGSWVLDDPDSPIALPETVPVWVLVDHSGVPRLATAGALPIDDLARRQIQPPLVARSAPGAFTLGAADPETEAASGLSRLLYLSATDGFCTSRWLDLGVLNLDFTDTDGDGAADRLSGVVIGTGRLAGEGLVGARPFLATLAGVPDTTPPRRLPLPPGEAGPGAGPRGPAEAFALHFDEPVSLAPGAVLVLGAERVPVVADGANPTPAHTLRLRPESPLPWGVTPQLDLSVLDAAGNALRVTGELDVAVAPAPTPPRDLATGAGFALRGAVVGHAPDPALAGGATPFLLGGPGPWRADFSHPGGGTLAVDLTALSPQGVEAATFELTIDGSGRQDRIAITADPAFEVLPEGSTIRIPGVENLGVSPAIRTLIPLPAGPVHISLSGRPTQAQVCGGFFASQALAVAVAVE